MSVYSPYQPRPRAAEMQIMSARSRAVSSSSSAAGRHSSNSPPEHQCRAGRAQKILMCEPPRPLQRRARRKPAYARRPGSSVRPSM